MALIRVSNSLAQNSTKTFISSPVTAGGTSIPVQNVNTFTTNWAIQVGNTGEERAEIKLIDSVSGLNLRTTGTLTFDHPIDTPVYATKYDQVVFKRATAGTAGTVTPLSSGTVTIQADQPFTQLDDSSAQSGYAYKASFRNSITGDESSDSDWLAIEGYSFYSRAKLRERVREKLFDSSFIQDDETINNWLNEWMEIMNNAAVNVNKDYSMGTVSVSFGTAGLGTITSADFKDIRKMEITYDGNNYYNADRIDQTDFQPNEVYLQSVPAYYPYGDNIFGVKPDGIAGTARISYYTQISPMDSDNDELPRVFRAYTKSFVDYALSQAYLVDNKPEIASMVEKNAIAQRNVFISQITPRSFSGARYIKEVEEIDANSYENI